MTDAINEAERLYVEARSAARSVILDLDATTQQITDAKAARTRMWEGYRDSILADIHSRTALLQKLLTELETVRTSIQTNPLSAAFDRVNSVIGDISNALEDDN